AATVTTTTGANRASTDVTSGLYCDLEAKTTGLRDAAGEALVEGDDLRMSDSGQGFDAVDDPRAGADKGRVGIDCPHLRPCRQHAALDQLGGHARRVVEVVAAGHDDDVVGVGLGDVGPLDAVGLVA